jgi:hypothetical protein
MRLLLGMDEHGDKHIVGRPALVVECKAPHKVTTPMLRVDLQETKLEEVIKSASIPQHDDDEGLFRYHAER